MRYIRYIYENGYCGCDEEDVMEFEDGTTDDEIEEWVADGLYSYAESYEHAAEGWSWDEGWDSDDDEEFYYDNCSFSWEEISEEEYNEFRG